MRIFLRVAPGLVALILMVGCSSQAAPKCSAPEIADAVIRIITQGLDQNLVMQGLTHAARVQGKELRYRLAGITTTSTDQQTGAQFCEATLTAVVTRNGIEEPPIGDEVIEYKSEWGDDGKPYVTVFGF